MIKLVGVEKTLGGQPVLRGVDLTIPEGKTHYHHRWKRLGQERAAEAYYRSHAA